MPCDDQWYLECYALSILLPDENDENKIEFGVSELVEELPTTPIYLLEKQPPLQPKYFNNHSQEIRPKKAHEIDAGYDLRYPGKDTLILQPKFLTKINLKIAFEIPPRAIIQIASRSSLASKGINIRGEVIDAGYTRDITIMLQNKTDKPFKIKHAEKIAQAIYLPLINISGLQSVNNREQLGKSERRTQDFGSTGQFTVPVNIVCNTQNKSHQILQLLQPITISSFGEHQEIYTCSKPTTTQQIFESNEQIYENPQIVSNFIEIVKHTLLPNPNIIPTTENYHLLEEKLSRINMVIAYASRTLKPTELKYGSTELEAAAVIWACKHFQQYLKNGKEFDIITDNIGLKWLNKKKLNKQTTDILYTTNQKNYIPMLIASQE
ncbi:hypothetical protein G9A89_018238 [Geosiphon pyriformis]|nr:hypothetical protein G9A89_018238 [Geosiphon pyriformis]